MSALFRDEALALRSRLLHGAAIAQLPLSWHLLTGFLLFLLVAIGVFLCTQSVSRRETAAGVLSLSSGELRVIARAAGTVDRVFVHEGQSVRRGDKLVSISTEQELAAGSTLDMEVLRTLEAEHDALERRVAAQDMSSNLETRVLARRLEGERNQLVDLQAALVVKRQRLETTRLAYETGKQYLRDALTTQDYQRQREYDYLSQLAAVRDADAQVSQLVGAIAQDEVLLRKLPHDHALARAALLNDLASLDGRKATVRGQGGYVLVAMSAGRVTALQAKSGQAVVPNYPLLAVIPAGSELQAELYVPSRAIGFVKPGQKVRLLYDAFPYQRFGAAYGVVSQVSSTVLRPEEVAAAVSVKEPVYRVLVRPEHGALVAYGSEFALRAGMALTADIVLEDRTFMQFLLDPILAAARRLGD